MTELYEAVVHWIAKKISAVLKAAVPRNSQCAVLSLIELPSFELPNVNQHSYDNSQNKASMILSETITNGVLTLR